MSLRKYGVSGRVRIHDGAGEAGASGDRGRQAGGHTCKGSERQTDFSGDQERKQGDGEDHGSMDRCGGGGNHGLRPYL